jgi:hypothetical protein
VDAYNIERALGDKYTDFSKMIFELDEETNFYGGSAAPRVPDNSHYTVWEEAGAAHETRVWWDYRWTTQQRDELAPDTPDPVNASCTVNQGRIDYSVRSMLFWTQLYLNTGQKPPSAPRVQRVSPTDDAPARDADGLAIGGLRHAFVQVPTALNSGAGCPFWGTYTPWSVEKIRSRYPSHADYLAKVTAWANHEVAVGWLLPEDRDRTIAQARAFDEPWPGEVLPQETTPAGSAQPSSAGGCLGKRPKLRARGAGAVRLGSTVRRLLAKVGAPRRVTKRAVRYCVKGGGTITAVLRRGRVALVASTVRGTHRGGVRVGGRGARPGLHRRGKVVYRVRKGRVRFVAVARSARGAKALARRV